MGDEGSTDVDPIAPSDMYKGHDLDLFKGQKVVVGGHINRLTALSLMTGYRALLYTYSNHW